MRCTPLVVALLALAACADPGKDSGDAEDDGCPAIAWDPESLSFGGLAFGVEGTATVSLLNTCADGGALTVEATVDDAAFAVSPALASVGAGELATLTVTALTTDYPEQAGSLALVTNDDAHPLVSIVLTATADPDQDGDASPHPDDCDDGDPAIHPAAEETWYDGVDQDCDGNDDDQDADGSAVGEDCDDLDPAAHPGAQEVWYDGVDQACDGGSDYDRDGDGQDAAARGGLDCDDVDATVFSGAAETWYDGVDQDCAADSDYDQDGDGQDAVAWGGADCDDLVATTYAGAPDAWYDGVDADCAANDDDDADADGYALALDCDDADAAVNPGAAEAWYDGVDQDCDGNDDDQDGDGSAWPADCEDLDAAVHPGAADAWYDGVDQDCDGASDYDQDGDGDDADAWGGTDCDDTDATVYYGAPDAWYDGVDADCAGNDDYDADRDGYPTTAGADCDDTDAAVNPAATEVWYDGVDQDCAGGSDYDQDGDGVAAYAYGGSDCADTDASTLAGTAETRNGVDDDCDGSVDEGLVAAGDVVITEVMAAPAAVSDTYGEWFEVYNAGTASVDLVGWTVYSDDGGYFTVGSSVPIAPGGYAVLGVSSDTSRNGGVTVDYVYSRATFGLSDAADSIYLEAGTTPVAELVYDATWPFTDGASLSLDPDFDDASDAGQWCSASSTYGSGDEGTPGGENDLCSSFDHDGDGESEDDGDCDDTDATISTSGTETFDGVDQDCDGLADDLTWDVSTLPSVYGMADNSYNYPLGQGDVDGDGDIELVTYTNSYRADGVWLIDGGTYASWSGQLDGFDIAAIDPGTTDGAIPAGHLGDNDGDGVDDLVFAYDNRDAGHTTDRWFLYRNPSGALTDADADIRCTGATASSTVGRVWSETDFDGDGVAEVVYGDYHNSDYYGYGGRVGVFDVSAMPASLTLADAELTVEPTAYGQYLGQYVGIGDFDDDGYADLAVSVYNGYIYLIPGNGLTTTVEDTFSSLATISVAETTAFNGGALEDYDGDGVADLISASMRVYTDLDTKSGALTTADATTDFDASGDWSCSFTTVRADFDEDGVRDVSLSCGQYVGSNYVYTRAFFGADVLANTTADLGDAILAIGATGGSSPVLLTVDDLDGDADDELVFVDAGTNARGYTYVADAP